MGTKRGLTFADALTFADGVVAVLAGGSIRASRFGERQRENKIK
jgi:hypothetical protein